MAVGKLLFAADAPSDREWARGIHGRGWTRMTADRKRGAEGFMENYRHGASLVEDSSVAARPSE